ncbi:MAG: hypothetical protein Q7T30_00590 [Planctomycetota bacterium]|nr:hypothetical protein [Planctomycetota bacterium]
MSTDGDDELDGRLMDWGLQERLGGERPPDLVAAVRARLETAEIHGGPSPMPRTTQRWLVAAFVLLGTAVVCGVAMWPQHAVEPVPAMPSHVQEPQRAHVGSVAEAAALPADTRAVEATDIDDAVVEALTRLGDLEVLVVREPSNESFGLSLKTQPPANPRHITRDSWRHFASFTKLRRLELSGTGRVWLPGPDDGADALALLERLPLLEHLALRCLDTRDAVLMRLPALRSLRSLDLSFDHGFVEEGVKALRQCRSLRRLSLRGCQQLHGNWLGHLHELPELEELDLSAIDGINWRSGPMFLDDQEAKQIRGWADSLGVGVHDGTLEVLAKSPRLRMLDISGGRWTNTGLRALGACTTLTDLSMFGAHDPGHDFVAALPKDLQRLEVCADYTDAFCTAVREHLPALRHICVAACYRITDSGLAELCAMPSLRVLDMRQMRGLTIATVDHLARAVQLEEIDIRHCDFVTAPHVARLRRALPRLAKLQSNFTDEEVAESYRLPDPIQVRTKAELDALPANTRHVLAMDIADDCMPSFARLRSLERLEITAEWASPGMRKVVPEVRSITDAGLRQLAGMPALRILKLGGELEVKGPGLDMLATLPMLGELELELMKVGDADLANVEKAVRLHILHLHYTQGFSTLTFAAIERMTTLRDVSLQGCVHVEDQWLAKIAALPNLAQLDLGRIGSRTHFSDWGGPLPPAEPGSGVTDRVLEAVGKAVKLRHLDLGYAGITGAGLKHLQGLPQLGYIDLTGTSLTANDLRWLPPGIEWMTLRNCAELGQDFGQALAAATPRLRILDLQSCSKITDACLKTLRELQSLRNLDLSYCPLFTADAVDDIVAMVQLEGLTLRGWQAFGDEQWAKVRTMPQLRRLDTDQGSEKLR